MKSANDFGSFLTPKVFPIVNGTVSFSDKGLSIMRLSFPLYYPDRAYRYDIRRPSVFMDPQHRSAIHPPITSSSLNTRTMAIIDVLLTVSIAVPLLAITALVMAAVASVIGIFLQVSAERAARDRIHVF